MFNIFNCFKKKQKKNNEDNEYAKIILWQYNYYKKHKNTNKLYFYNTDKL